MSCNLVKNKFYFFGGERKFKPALKGLDLINNFTVFDCETC